MLRFLAEVSGPDISLAALQALFTDVPRCVLDDLATRYRRVHRRRYAHEGARLEWLVPGRVWAIDFSQPQQPVDGCWPNLLAIRDLASHYQLTWQATATQTAAEACAVLERLFLDHGPPLVLKADNGSAFISAEFQALLARYQVVILSSPPRYPQYNGALERSNGTLKTYTQLDATRDGHPLRWTSDNVEHARELANQLTRPWGAQGPHPAASWAARTVITAAEREAFTLSVATQRLIAAVDLGIDPQAQLERDPQARLDRVAVPRVLIELRYLERREGRRARRRAGRPTLSAPRIELPTEAPPHVAPTEVCWAGPPQCAWGGSRYLASTGGTTPSLSFAEPIEHVGLLTWSPSPSQLAPPSQNLLAISGALDTMSAQYGVGDGATQPSPIPETAHREPSHTSWYGRPITPLVRSLKAANIM